MRTITDYRFTLVEKGPFGKFRQAFNHCDLRRAILAMQQTGLSPHHPSYEHDAAYHPIDASSFTLIGRYALRGIARHVTHVNGKYLIPGVLYIKDDVVSATPFKGGVRHLLELQISCDTIEEELSSPDVNPHAVKFFVEPHPL